MAPRPTPEERLLRAVLLSDVGSGDITSRAVIPAKQRLRAEVVAKSPGVLAGVGLAHRILVSLHRNIRCRVRRLDGQPVRSGDVIMSVDGPAREILAAERTALNVLSHLSGIATLTHEFVRRVRPLPAQVLDTRKTLPGLHALQKFAVRMGGGSNHRMGLHDAVLIKTNHLKIARRSSQSWPDVIREALQQARERYPKTMLEIEVRNLVEFRAALRCAPDVIMLDNWPVRTIHRAVQIRNAEPARLSLLEVSGGVTLDNVRAIAKTGVDRISIGRLTHSAPALDVALRVVEGANRPPVASKRRI